MNYLPFALTFAIISSINIIIYKRLTNSIHQFVAAWAGIGLSLPWLLLFALTFYKFPSVNVLFWIGVLGSSILNVFANIFALNAIKQSKISTITPISAFTPVFTALLAFFILHEKLSLQGIIGIILVSIGAYLLNISSIKKGILNPFHVLFIDKGVRLMFLSTIIWSITPIFEKTALQSTNPQNPPFVSFTAGLLLLIFFTPVVFYSTKHIRIQIVKKWKPLVYLGIGGAIASSCAFIAFTLSPLGFSSAIFKTSIFFTLIFAYLFLGERNIRDKFIGSIVMFIGVLFIIV